MRVSSLVATLAIVVIFADMPWSSSLDDNATAFSTKSTGSFWNDLVLVIIPVVGGSITSKWITNSWQVKKEKYELQKRILDEFDKYTISLLTSLQDLGLLLWESYFIVKADTSATLGKVNEFNCIFSDNKKDQPPSRFMKEYLNHCKIFFDAYQSVQRFNSTIRLFYKDDKLWTDFGILVDRSLEPARELQKAFYSENKDDFKKHMEKYYEGFVSVRTEIDRLRAILIQSKKTKF